MYISTSKKLGCYATDVKPEHLFGFVRYLTCRDNKDYTDVPTDEGPMKYNLSEHRQLTETEIDKIYEKDDSNIKYMYK